MGSIAVAVAPGRLWLCGSRVRPGPAVRGGRRLDRDPLHYRAGTTRQRTRSHAGRWSDRASGPPGLGRRGEPLGLLVRSMPRGGAGPSVGVSGVPQQRGPLPGNRVGGQGFHQQRTCVCPPVRGDVPVAVRRRQSDRSRLRRPAADGGDPDDGRARSRGPSGCAGTRRGGSIASPWLDPTGPLRDFCLEFRMRAAGRRDRARHAANGRDLSADTVSRPAPSASRRSASGPRRHARPLIRPEAAPPWHLPRASAGRDAARTAHVCHAPCQVHRPGEERCLRRPVERLECC